MFSALAAFSSFASLNLNVCYSFFAIPTSFFSLSEGAGPHSMYYFIFLHLRSHLISFQPPSSPSSLLLGQITLFPCTYNEYPTLLFVVFFVFVVVVVVVVVVLLILIFFSLLCSHSNVFECRRSLGKGGNVSKHKRGGGGGENKKKNIFSTFFFFF